MEDNVIIGEIKPKEFVTVDIYVSALYEKYSTSLSVEQWKRLIPPEEYDSFGKNDAFIDFEEMLNYIEQYTPYTLFALVPYTNMFNKIKLIYIHK